MSTEELLQARVRAGGDVHVLTLREPYASLIAWGLKKIETRTRSTSHRGLLAIHVAQGTPIPCATEHVERLNAAQAGRDDWTFTSTDKVGLASAQGRIIAVVDLVEVRELRPEDERAACFYAPGRKAWVLAPDVIRVEPVPFRGCQGFGRIAASALDKAAARKLSS